MANDDIWILGINMTKFGKHPDKDVVDLASEAALAALADGGVTIKDMGILAAGNLMGAAAGIGQQLQKQIGQTGIPVFNVANACASCGGTSFKKTDIATEGEIRSFTIVTAFIPGADNYVPVVVDLGGTSVRGQLINTPADAANIALGQKVRLTTYSIGADTAGTEAINYGFEPVN